MQAGTTSAVKAVKMGARLMPGRQQAAGDRPPSSDTPRTAHVADDDADAVQRDGLTWEWETPRQAQGVALAGGARSVCLPAHWSPGTEEPLPISQRI